MKTKNTRPVKLMMAALLLISMTVFWMHRPWLDPMDPASKPSENKTGINALQAQDNATATDLSHNVLTTANPINPLRTDAEVLKSIAQQNENLDQRNSLLAATATLTAQVRQQTEAAKYQTIASQTIPAPDTTPAPADILAKLKSNQLIHH